MCVFTAKIAETHIQECILSKTFASMWGLGSERDGPNVPASSHDSGLGTPAPRTPTITHHTKR